MEEHGIRTEYYNDGTACICDQMVKIYYTSNKIKEEIPFVGNTRHGVCKKYYESGALETECPYVYGLENGVVKTYYESGAIKEKSIFANGLRDGLADYFYESGLLKKMAFYANGILKTESEEFEDTIVEDSRKEATKANKFYFEFLKKYYYGDVNFKDFIKLLLINGYKYYFKYLLAVILIIIGIFCINEPALRVALISAGIIPLSFMAYLYKDCKYNTTRNAKDFMVGNLLASITVISFFVVLGSFAVLLVAKNEKYASYSVQLPKEVVRDSACITLKSDNIEVKSCDVPVFVINNPILCKAERYNFFHMRLRDRYTIKSIKKCVR